MGKRSHGMERLVQHLQAGEPLTSSELLAVCFCHPQTLKIALYKLRSSGQAHIAGWRDNRAALWTYGPGEDVQRNPGMNDREKYQLRKKGLTSMERDVIRNRRNARLRKVKGDPLVNLFFGG